MTNTKRRSSSTSDLPPVTTVVTIPKSGVVTEREARPVERIGDALRRAREQRGDDLQQIADYLCIRRTYLEAIEESRYDAFPADAYIIGFLRSYANLLGIDGRQAIDRYRGEMAGRRKKPSLSMPTPMTEGRTPSAMIMIAAVIVAFLIYMAWYGLSSSDRARISRPPALPTTTVATDMPETLSATGPLPQVTAPVNALPAPVVSPAPRLMLRADQASWILIADGSGHTIYDHVLKPGETYRVPDMEGLTLTSGNYTGLTLTLNGIDLPRAYGSSGRVIKNMPLDTAALKSQFAIPAAE